MKSTVAFWGNGSWDTGRDRTVRARSGLNIAWRPGGGGLSQGPGKQLLTCYGLEEKVGEGFFVCLFLKEGPLD